MNERILLSTMATSRVTSGDYKIGPEDLLEIAVFEVEKLNKTVRVSARGDISLPLLGILKVKGLTANELEKKISDLLAEKYLKDPYVTVFIKEYRNQRISVIGMVEKPGIYEVAGQKTVLGMLAMAGGLKEDAGRLLFLLRPPPSNEDDPKPMTGPALQAPLAMVIDLDELLIKGDLSLNVPTFSGDVINVPTSGKVFVGGEVSRPGGFPLKGRRVTVTQAIALAEGLKSEADGADIRIFRFSGKGNEKEVIAVNYYEIVEGKAIDLPLKENDIVIVPLSGVKNFWAGFRDFFRFSFGVGFWRPF
ncbi:MAG: polysaccharide biosynthesis/export family protein [Syntrophaceae bacterium]|nr:polysaccharide biosynthesis/export family protein [Syntrophaceae bacterium]